MRSRSRRIIIAITLAVVMLFTMSIATIVAVDKMRQRSAERLLSEIQSVPEAPDPIAAAKSLASHFPHIPERACDSDECLFSIVLGNRMIIDSLIKYPFLVDMGIRPSAAVATVYANSREAYVTFGIGSGGNCGVVGMRNLEAVNRSRAMLPGYSPYQVSVGGVDVSDGGLGPWGYRVFCASRVSARMPPTIDAASRARLLQFRLDCLRTIGKACKPCQVAPGICTEYYEGNGYNYSLPKAVRERLREVIAGIPVGMTANKVHARLDPVLQSFPKLGPNSETDPAALVYFFDRWRVDFKGDPTLERTRDRYVRFVFDAQSRLVRIESTVESVPSRP